MTLIKNIFSRFKSLNKKKKVLLAVGIVVIIYLCWTIFFPVSKQPQYQTATVEKGTLVTSVSSSGSVSSANGAEISTSLSGVVKEVYVKNGDYVNQGENIALITPDSSSQQKQAAAYASYLSAQNSFNSAKSKINSLQSALFKANQSFVNDKGITDPDTDDPKYIEERADWLQAESDYNNQQGVIAAAGASLTSASLSYALYSSVITAPISGVVNNLSIGTGATVTQSSSSTSDTSSAASKTIGSVKLSGQGVTATVNLTEIDVTKVKIGQRVTLTLDAFVDKTFTGTVSSIDTSGSVSSGVTTYPATITFDSAPDNIYPNMAVTAQIITKVKDDVVLVPTQAVQTSNDTKYVRVLKNGQVTQATVETGDSSDTQTEIKSGLTEGETIIVSEISTTTSGNSSTSVFGGSLRVGGFGGGGFTGGTRNNTNR